MSLILQKISSTDKSFHDCRAGDFVWYCTITSYEITNYDTEQLIDKMRTKLHKTNITFANHDDPTYTKIKISTDQKIYEVVYDRYLILRRQNNVNGKIMGMQYAVFFINEDITACDLLTIINKIKK